MLEYNTKYYAFVEGRIMNIETRALGKGASLGIVNTDKFKNSYFAVNFLLPLSDKNISECSVLASVLLRGTKKHPSVSAISKHIGMIYDPSIEVSATKTSSALVFKVGAYFLCNDYLPKNESLDVFGEVCALFTELLTEPALENGALSASFTESEKKRQIDKIRARINNKDTYALSRCSALMLGDIPAASDALGTEDAVSAVTPKSLYEMLDFILRKCPVEAVFAGKLTTDAEKTATDFITSLTKDRDETEILSRPTVIKPSFDGEVKEITEDVSATQGRMVMGFSMPDLGEKTGAIEVFNEIFGGSPVSRLFTNVRERLQLCYYCASAQNIGLNVMYVRSGINRENLDQAKDEIMRQLEQMKDPENISDEELNVAKLGIVSGYNSTCDSPLRYASWYINRRISGRHTDIERCRAEVESTERREVSDVAKAVRPVINYFLNGIEG